MGMNKCQCKANLHIFYIGTLKAERYGLLSRDSCSTICRSSRSRFYSNAGQFSPTHSLPHYPLHAKQSSSCLGLPDSRTLIRLNMCGTFLVALSSRSPLHHFVLTYKRVGKNSTIKNRSTH